MKSSQEGHFEVIQGIMVQPDEENHEDWYETSYKGDGIKYFSKASLVQDFPLVELIGDSKEDILREIIRMVGYSG